MKIGFSSRALLVTCLSFSVISLANASVTSGEAPDEQASLVETISQAPDIEPLTIKSSGFSPERAAFKAAGGLLLMVGVLFGVAYIAKRKGLMRNGGRRKLILRETLSLGAKEKLVVVDFAGESMVVGITAHNIRLIRSVKKSEAEDYEANPQLGAKTAFDFQTKLNDFLLKGSQ